MAQAGVADPGGLEAAIRAGAGVVQDLGRRQSP